MPYVERDQNGNVVGRFSMLQPGTAEEFLEDEHPDLVPSIVVPQSVPMRKAREILIDRNKFTTVNNAIYGMTGTAGLKAQNEWEKSQVVLRNRPLTLSMFALIGVNTDAERDQWFIDADALP
jgi:hypothetical protein